MLSKFASEITSGLVEVINIIPQPAYRVGPQSARPRNPWGGEWGWGGGGGGGSGFAHGPGKMSKNRIHH